MDDMKVSSDDYFKFGKVIDVDKLSPEQAAAALGQPVYEALKNTWQLGPFNAKGRLRVAAIDRQRGTVLLEWETS